MLKLLVYVRDLLVRCVTDEVNKTTSSFSRQPLDVITKSTRLLFEMARSVAFVLTTCMIFNYNF